MLRAKNNGLRQQAKKQVTDGTIKPAEERATFEKLRSEKFTDQERKVLETGVSNAEFHHLGSAKILGGIGKAFAEATAQSSP